LFVLTASLDAKESSRPAHPFLVVGKHAERVYRALSLLQRLLRSEAACDCVKYFEERGWRISKGISNGGLLVIFTDVEFPASAWDAHGLAQAQSPWSVIHLNPSKLSETAWPRLDDCALASVLLHEMGHLARKDRADNEPADFFRKCRVKFLDPKGWR
jgi:hypothetical protein